MNEKKSNSNSRLSENSSEIPQTSSVPSSRSSIIFEDVETSVETTYASFFWFLFYAKMYVTRLGRDLFQSAKHYFYPDQILPTHIVDLMKVQSELCKERESQPTKLCREHILISGCTYSIRKFSRAFKSCILCSEDDMGLPYSLSKQHTEIAGIDKEPMFVLVDSSGLSDPASNELLIRDKDELRDTILRKYFHKYIKPADLPSTSRDISIPVLGMGESESREEMQMMDINLQSENDITLDDIDIDNESIVIAYLRNKNIILEYEDTLLSSKKKSSLLESVPKMETIVEGEQFTTFSPSKVRLAPANSECSLEEDTVD